MVKFVRISILLTILSVASAQAGWFGPTPPEIHTNHPISVENGGHIDVSVVFTERSTYKIELVLEPRIEFHSPDGGKLDWGEVFELSATIGTGSDVYYKYDIEDELDHTLGYGLGFVKVPRDIPKGNYILSIQFGKIGGQYEKNYDGARIVVTKLPYIRLLD